jgi:hypothetical protein
MIVLAGLCHPSAYVMLAAVLVFFVLNLGWRRWQFGPTERWLPMLIVVLLVVLTAVLLPLVIHVQRVKSDVSLLHLAQTTVFFVRPPLLVAAVGGALLLFDRGERAAVLLTCWAVVPLLVLGVLSATLTVGVTAYYAFYILPAVCLLAGEFIQVLAWRVRLGGFRGLLLRVVPLGILVLDMGGQDYLYFEKYHGERPQWREAFWEVLRQSGTRIRIVTTNAPSIEYYRDRGAPLTRLRGRDVEVVPIAEGLAPGFVESQVRGALADGRDVFVLVTEPELDQIDPAGHTESYLRGNLLQVQSYPNWTGPKDMTVLVYRP